MNERIKTLKQHISELDKAGVRYNLSYGLIAGSLKETLGEPVPIRRAKAFTRLLDNAEQAVLPCELIAGSVAGLWPLAENLPSYEERSRQAREVIREYIRRKLSSQGGDDRTTRFALIARDHYEANICYEELKSLTEELCEEYRDNNVISKYEIGRELENHFQFDYGTEVMELYNGLPWEAANHLDLNYGNLIDRGLNSILIHAQKSMAKETDDKKTDFFRSVIISLEAAIRFIDRYAATLESVATDSGTDEARRCELREMARICRKISDGKPETFREALQLLWMTHVIQSLAGGSALSFARFDQYMYPFYSNDVRSGRMTRDEAKLLVSCMWLKVNEPKMRTVQSICLAGTTPEGGYGANELTVLCLEVCAELKLPYPNTSVRISGQTPDWLYEKVMDTMKENKGNPMLLNDEKWIPNLQKLGYTLNEARDYYNMGCVEMMIQGKQPTWRSAGRINFPGVLELVFRNGKKNMAGETGIETGRPDSLDTFGKFLEAYKMQLSHRVDVLCKQGEEKMRVTQKVNYDPFASALVEGCIENCTDLLQGGSTLKAPWHITAQGLATAADSLSAIKRFVYDEKMFTLERMLDMLNNNYSGCEMERMILDARTECFGNDNDEVDGIARDILATYSNVVHSYNNKETPGIFVTSVFSYTLQVRMGETVMATPNGRCKGMPLSDNAGPSQGKDKGGPTKLINSVLKLDHSGISGGYAFNLKINPNLLEGHAGRNAFTTLVKAYFEQDGLQMQFNFISPEILREAQMHPENFEGLLVRVAGFCEYFNNLDRSLQDEIISRTMH